jgi:transcriptional regulator NrdR family protein
MTDKTRDNGVDRCPGCKSNQTEVVNTRSGKYGRRRNRKCLICELRWVTMERPISITQRDANIPHI